MTSYNAGVDCLQLRIVSARWDIYLRLHNLGPQSWTKVNAGSNSPRALLVMYPAKQTKLARLVYSMLQIVPANRIDIIGRRGIQRATITLRKSSGRQRYETSPQGRLTNSVCFLPGCSYLGPNVDATQALVVGYCY